MDSLYCIQCHKPLAPTDIFCKICGADQRNPRNRPEPTTVLPAGYAAGSPPPPQDPDFTTQMVVAAASRPVPGRNYLRTAAVILVICLLRAYSVHLSSTGRDFRLPLPSGARNLLEARDLFATRHIPNSYTPDPTVALPPPEIFQTVHYPSPVGPLLAYLSPDPGDGKKHPAVIWAHGGFGGIGDFLWKKDDQQDPGQFREAGIIVMCPSWRNENDNPGQFQLFYGEVEDAVAAVDYLSRVPYVDPSRIYFAGHSTGGTMTLLTAESTLKLRAAFSFGGCPDMQGLMDDTFGKGYGNTPYEWHNNRENEWRSPIQFVSYIHTPTFYFEGSESGYPPDAMRMQQRAREEDAPFAAYTIEGGTHFTILQPETALVAQKILADTGPTCNIHFTQAEVQAAFENHRNGP